MLDNFGIVIPDGNGGGLLTRSAQPLAPHGYGTLRDMGVDHIVQLNGTDDRRYWQGLYWGKDLGTWCDFEEKAEEAIEVIHGSVVLGRRVHVHCTHGRDRTGGV